MGAHQSVDVRAGERPGWAERRSKAALVLLELAVEVFDCATVGWVLVPNLNAMFPRNAAEIDLDT